MKTHSLNNAAKAALIGAVALLVSGGTLSAGYFEQDYFHFDNGAGSGALSADGKTAIVGAGSVEARAFTNGAWSFQFMPFVNDAVGNPRLGTSLSLSADGNTALVGGLADNSFIGAAWVYTRSNGAWTQQGPKLVGSGSTPDQFGEVLQGFAVALSADGNTAAVTGRNDANSVGAAWIFVRNNGVWTQQGSKLTPGPGAVGGAAFGTSVAMSSDGNTVIFGGPGDNSAVGAAWVFTRTNGTWSQQAKLVASNSAANGTQGIAVALSGDGNLALVVGLDASGTWGAWSYTRSGSTWTQEPTRLLDKSTDTQVAIAADGATAVLGAPHENSGCGDLWIYPRDPTGWKLPSKLSTTIEGSCSVTPGNDVLQGVGVSISGDGKTLLAVGEKNNGSSPTSGAYWIFARANAAASHDFNANGRSDILWRNTAGDTTIWLMNGPTVSSAPTLGNVPTAWSVVGTGDFDGDGNADILWRSNTGDLAIWLMNGGTIVSSTSLGNVPSAWTVAGIGDFDGDSKSDILWRNASGDIAMWLISGGRIVSGSSLGNIPTAWNVAAVADFDGDGKADILWRHTSGDLTFWMMNGSQIVSGVSLGNVPNAWTVAGANDFDGNGQADLLWRNTGGDAAIWLNFPAGHVASAPSLGNIPTAWTIVETGDFNGDGKGDILWRNTSGDFAMWLMNGGQIASGAGLGNVPTVWSVQNVNAN